jgi:hypothetical protein
MRDPTSEDAMGHSCTARTALALIMMFCASVTNSATGQSTPRQQCLAHCSAADTECGSATRAAKKRCATSAATKGVDPVTLKRDSGAMFCGYFMEGHCDYARDRSRCEDRFRLRHGMCMDSYEKTTAQRYLGCTDNERAALLMCRDELRDCRAACD